MPPQAVGEVPHEVGQTALAGHSAQQGAEIDAQDLVVPRPSDVDCHHRRPTDHSVVHAALVLRSVDPQVAMIASQGPRPKRKAHLVDC